MKTTNEEAIHYITNNCQSIGAFHGVFPCKLLKKIAEEIKLSKPSEIFPTRYKEHVAYAVDMIADNVFLSPPSAIASVYLATRFEYYFRILSGKLNGDGTWISSEMKNTVKQTLKNNRLDREKISSVSLTYRILMLDTSLQIVQQFLKIDNCLYQNPTILPDNQKVSNIGDRIEFVRNQVSHGHWGDISSESVSYGLLTGIVFYNQSG